MELPLGKLFILNVVEGWKEYNQASYERVEPRETSALTLYYILCRHDSYSVVP